MDLLHLTRNLSPGDGAPTDHLHPTIAGGSEDVIRLPVIVVDRQSRFDSAVPHLVRRNDREPEVAQACLGHERHRVHAVVREHPGATIAENAARLRLSEREHHESDVVARQSTLVGEGYCTGGVVTETGVLLLERRDLRLELVVLVVLQNDPRQERENSETQCDDERLFDALHFVTRFLVTFR